MLDGLGYKSTQSGLFRPSSGFKQGVDLYISTFTVPSEGVCCLVFYSAPCYVERDTGKSPFGCLSAAQIIMGHNP